MKYKKDWTFQPIRADDFWTTATNEMKSNCET